MTTRTRLIYSKRKGACFVPHIALAQMFSRSASRAGLTLTMTQGFSPRPKISFAPELPAGVVALNEPVDMYFESVPENIAHLMNDALPEGFTVTRAEVIPENSPSLGKVCKSAEYLIRSVKGLNLLDDIKNFWGVSVLSAKISDGWLRVIVAEPAQNPIGGLIRGLVGNGVVNGWHEVNIVRASIGLYDSETESVKL